MFPWWWKWTKHLFLKPKSLTDGEHSNSVGENVLKTTGAYMGVYKCISFGITVATRQTLAIPMQIKIQRTIVWMLIQQLEYTCNPNEYTDSAAQQTQSPAVQHHMQACRSHKYQLFIHSFTHWLLNSNSTAAARLNLEIADNSAAIIILALPSKHNLN